MAALWLYHQSRLQRPPGRRQRASLRCFAYSAPTLAVASSVSRQIPVVKAPWKKSPKTSGYRQSYLKLDCGQDPSSTKVLMLLMRVTEFRFRYLSF